MFQVIVNFLFNKFLEWRYISMLGTLNKWETRPLKNKTFNSSSILNNFRVDKRYVHSKNKHRLLQ